MTCDPADPQFRLAVVRLFREGNDTKVIAFLLKTRESVVWNALCRFDHLHLVRAVAS